MAYCHFYEGVCDVHMYFSGTVICNFCKLRPERDSVELKTLQLALEHLMLHRFQGHLVPEDAIARLKLEMSTQETIFGRALPTDTIGIPTDN